MRRTRCQVRRGVWTEEIEGDLGMQTSLVETAEQDEEEGPLAPDCGSFFAWTYAPNPHPPLHPDDHRSQLAAYDEDVSLRGYREHHRWS